MGSDRNDREPFLPELDETEVDDDAWIAALEDARRAQFAELAEL